MDEKKSMLMKDFYKLVDQLRSKIGAYNFYSNFVCLLFLKYVITYSDTIEFTNINSYKEIISFKRKYDAVRNGQPLEQEDFYKVLNGIDDEPVLGNLHLINCAKNYIEIFKDEKNQIEVINLIEQLDFFTEPEAIGILFEIILKRSEVDVQKTLTCVTNQSLRTLAEGFLKVTEDDVYLDCYSGYSSTLFDISKYKRYIGYEINFETALISKMMLFMNGKKNFEINNENFLENDTHEIADKVFADGPISVRGDYPELCLKFGVQTRDSDVLSIFKIVDSIKEGGTGVITVPGKVLFSDARGYHELRRFLCGNGLKAVISLPPLWAGTMINTNLLVIQKGYKGNVEFVEAKDLGYGDKRNTILSSETIEKIIEHVNEGISETSFSASVDYRDVMCIGSWLPSRYIAFKVDSNYRDVSEIDNELDDLVDSGWFYQNRVDNYLLWKYEMYLCNDNTIKWSGLESSSQYSPLLCALFL